MESDAFSLPRDMVIFSVREELRQAILEPDKIVDRHVGEGWKEDYAHWQTRAVISVVLHQATESRLFAKTLASRLHPTILAEIARLTPGPAHDL